MVHGSPSGRTVTTRSGSLVNMSTGTVEIDRNNFGPPDIDPSEITYINKIGGGCFGSVYEGTCRGMRVAVKKLFKQDFNEKHLQEFKKEVELCSQLNHPNVLLFMGACTVPGEMAIVTEICTRGNLEQLLHHERAQLSLYKRMEMAKEAAVGMAWLHGMNPQIVHRDLKPSNLLVDKHGQIKVCDFGLSAAKPANESLQDVDTIPGTPLWMPPEVMMGRKITEKADVYSFAIVLWEIVTQKVPFPDVNSFPKFRQAVCLNGERPPLGDIKHSSICELLQKCWHKNPESRPSFTEIVEEIEDIMIDCAIKDPDGRRFWKERLPKKEFISFEKFLPMFLDHTNLALPDTVHLECLKMLVATQYKDDIMEPEDVVRIGDFGKLLENFGPITHLKEGKKGKLITVFDRIYQTCKQPWFHGDISTAQAETLLKVHGPGYYLVRLSSSVSGCFTISRVTKAKSIHHHRVDYRGDQNYATRSLNKKDIIKGKDMSLRSFIANLKESMNLVNACPGSKYRVLFKAALSAPAANGDGYGLGDGEFIDD